jgi:hypothetical protein
MAFFFFAGFLDTDNGLNIKGFPTNFTSSAGFCPSTCDALGGGRLSPDPPFVVAGPLSSSPAYSLSSSGSLLKPGADPVFKLTPTPSTPFAAVPPPNVAFVCPVRFGGGKNELNPLKAPPPVFARLVGGSSLEVSSFKVACGKETRILPGFDRSTTFWNAGFDDVAVDLGVGTGASSVSEASESE